jgi:hypothetical protein
MAQEQASTVSAANPGTVVAPAAPATASTAPATEAADPAASPAKPDSTAPAAGANPAVKRTSAGKVKGLKVKKEKPPKTIHMEIEHGVLTVDGWTGKANLNYDIDDFQYFYMWAPGIGTVIVSNHPFPGAKIQYSAFDKNTLTVKLDDHQLQLTADHRILPGKPKEPDAPAYVAVDPGFSPTTARFPVFGYGSTNKAPYAWPGSLVDLKASKDAPPLPVQVQPTIQTATVCPAGVTPAPATAPTGAAPTGTTAGAGPSGCKSVPVPMATGKNKKQEKDATM